MKIKIRENAAELFMKLADSENMEKDDEFYRYKEVLSDLAGKTVDVDTSILHKHLVEINPIEGITEEDEMIHEDFIEVIYDDVRIGKAYCHNCYEISDSIEICTNCGDKNNLDPLFDENE